MALDIPTVSYDSIAQDRRDEDFFIETITFKVEDTLFRVPKMGFMDPECFFAGMFDLPGPGPNGQQIQGTTDDCPIVLEGESKAHFKAFLKVLYPSLYRSLPKSGKPYDSSVSREMDVHSYDEWIGILHLSTKWCFSKIRKSAIESISRLKLSKWEPLTMREACDAITLAREYNVRRWLYKGYQSLVEVRTPHDVNQLVEAMGGSGALKLLQIRETTLMALVNKNSGRPVPVFNVEKLILEAFTSEFATMEIE